MELNLFEVILAGYLSSILLLMWRLWWPCHKFIAKIRPNHPVVKWWGATFIIFLLGFIFAGPMVWVCIVSDEMREKFCARYVVTILENEE